MKMKFLPSLVVLFVFVSCGEIYTPKPRGYNHIDLPQHDYVKWSDDTKPYAFEVNKLSQVKPYISAVIKEDQDFVNVEYPSLQAKLWVTYYDIFNNVDSLNSYISTSFKLTDKHNVKATGIDSEVLCQRDGKYAVGVTIEGDVPSQYQFFVHDSTDHFIRVALYFNTATKNDSLAPVIDYLKDEMMHMIETVEWKEELN